MTDFETAMLSFLQDAQNEFNSEKEVDCFIRKHAPKLMEAARKQLMAEIWHKATVERPETKKDVKLLGWFDTGSTAYDFDIIKFRVRDGEFCDRNGHPLMTDKLWWRTLEKPIKED